MSVSTKRIIVTGGSGFIGVHLIETLIKQNYIVLNLDIKPPVDNVNLASWRRVSMINKDQLRIQILDFDPHYIVHLAATTTQDAKSIDDFEVNIKGTQNLLDISSTLTNLKKFVFTSTQYVNSPGYPISEILEELRPYGLYGESKLFGEKMIRDSLQNSSWTIIRPTTIWGPWHPILVNGLWKQILKGRYFHPKRDSAVKAYGYVKNSVWQIIGIMEMENKFTDKRVFYIGDENILQDRWVRGFVTRLTGQKMRKIPRIVLYIISEIGERLNKLGVKFPLYRSRYRNLVTSNPSPLEATLELLGPSPMALEIAVEETCSWLEQMNGTTRRLD